MSDKYLVEIDGETQVMTIEEMLIEAHYGVDMTQFSIKRVEPEVTLYALMYEDEGKWKLAHRIKRSHSIYSSPVSHRPLVFDTYEKAEKALKPTSIGNYLPEGTKIVTLKGSI